MLRSKGLPFVVFAWLALGAPVATAVPTYHVELDPDKFGQLDKQDTDCQREGCGPVAAVNSFVWLQNRWPAVYGKKLLLDGDLKNTANALLAGEYMNTDCRIFCAHGTYWEEFLYGKAKWIEDRVGGKTAYRAETKFEWGKNYDLPDERKDKVVLETVSGNIVLLENTSPAWQFLYLSLKDSKDVEILMTFADDSGHYITLYSFDWTDKNADNVVDRIERAKIGFIDPTKDGFSMLGEARLWQEGKDQPLKIEYTRNDQTREAEITFAVREAALVPEPGGLALAGTGLITLVLFSRRRAARRAIGVAVAPKGLRGHSAS